LPQPFALCSEQPRCYLSAAANSSSSSSATKRVGGQGASVQSTRVRCRRWRRRAPSTGPARPRCRPQSRTAPAAALRRTRRRRSTLRATVWPQLVPPSPLRAGAERPTPRCGAAPARALPVYARAPCARTVWTAPKRALRAGAQVAATAPAPSSAGRSSAITSHCWSLDGKLHEPLVYQVSHMSLLGLQSSDSGLRTVTNPSESPHALSQGSTEV